MSAGTYVPAFTKYLVPELPVSYVARPTLCTRLDALAREFPITLVVGYPGSGKTVLVAEWARGRAPAGSVAWLSCDTTDVSPRHFWTALVHALRAFDPDLGQDVLDLLEGAGDLGDDLLAELVNDMAAITGPCVVVVDDVHLVGPAALQSFAGLLERLPPALHFVLCARADPRLPIHRWRVAGRLGEMRTADLRLATEDVERVLGAMGVEVSAETADLLAVRTEGWAAGVQLAALSMRAAPEPEVFVRAFAGSDRNVTDFLVGEVLSRQPPDVVDFLMTTSILDHFDAAICNALTSRDDAGSVLEGLEAQNLLLIPLDNERTYYRYHQLFQDLLRRLLHARDPARFRAVHAAASVWYERAGDIGSALRHAASAEQSERVFELLRAGLLAGYFTGRGDLVRTWIADLELAPAGNAPDLVLEYVLALLLVGEIQEAAIWLDRLDAIRPTRPTARFEVRFEVAHALYASLRGDFAGARAHIAAGQAVPGQQDDEFIVAAPLLLIRMDIREREFDRARALYDAMAARPLEPLVRLTLEGVRASCEWEAGDLRTAVVLAERTLAAMEDIGSAMHHGAHDAIRTLARAALEADRLDDAERLVERSLAVSTGVRPPYEVLSLVDRAKVWWARGETDAAYETLDRARTLVAPDVRPSPLLDYVSVTEARWRAEQGDVVRARELALALDDGRERETVGIRCHLAAREFDQARAALDVLVKDERTPRNELVDALLAARVDIGRGDDPGQALEHVLAIGRAHGFVRTLIDEGTDFTDALARELRRRPGDDYTDALVRAIDATARRVPVARVVLPGNVTLSERETTVLRLLATRMTMREIAGELFVSLNTLKTHCKSIYRKLGADSRRSAVEAARTFGVLSPAPG